MSPCSWMIVPCSSSFLRVPFVLKVFHILPNVSLQLDDRAVFVVLFESAVRLEGLLQGSEDFVKVHWQDPATPGQSHLLRETLHRRPGLPAVTLLHPNVNLAAAIVTLVKAARRIEVLHRSCRGSGCPGLTSC